MPGSAALPHPMPWSKVVHRSVLHAMALAATALTQAWSKAASSSRAESDRLRAELALLAEELELKDARWARVPAHRRPHYSPVQRMRILEQRAARGWSTTQTAERFLVTEETIASWMQRLDEEGGLVRPARPRSRKCSPARACTSASARSGGC